VLGFFGLEKGAVGALVATLEDGVDLLRLAVLTRDEDF
jgi:hypothetical protein